MTITTLEQAIEVIKKQQIIINALLLQQALFFSNQRAASEAFEVYRKEYEKHRDQLLGDYDPSSPISIS